MECSDREPKVEPKEQPICVAKMKSGVDKSSALFHAWFFGLRTTLAM
jgi:hypothetical protein